MILIPKCNTFKFSKFVIVIGNVSIWLLEKSNDFKDIASPISSGIVFNKFDPLSLSLLVLVLLVLLVLVLVVVVLVVTY